MSKNKIIDYFLKEAETGNWDKIKYSDVEKKLNLKKATLRRTKNFFHHLLENSCVKANDFL